MFLGCSGCFGGVLGCFWLFMVVEVEMVFQGSFKDVSRKFESVSTKFQGCFKKVSRCFKKVSRLFQGSFKGVSRKF